MSILLVGSVGVGKQTLTQRLYEYTKENSDDYEYDIFSTGQIPCSEYEEESIDYIVFMINLLDVQSFYDFRDSIQYLSSEYLLRHCCVLVTHVDSQHQAAVDRMDIKNYVKRIDPTFPLYYANLLDTDTVRHLTGQLINAVNAACGHRVSFLPTPSIRQRHGMALWNI